MTRERIKSYILAFLVITSLVLTFVIWNYKPNYSTIKGEANYLNEINLGGTEQTKKSIIHPSKIVFHKNKEISGFANPNEQQMFYRRMQEWELVDYQTGPSRGLPTTRNYLEVVYPDALPVEIINSLFKLTDKVDLPNWSFNRLYVGYQQNTATLSVLIISIDNHQQVNFKVTDADHYADAWSYIQTDKEQVPYVVYGYEERPIYVPAGEPTMLERLMSVNSINVNLLVTGLFSDPWIVNPNNSEGYLSDGQRRIKLLEDRRSMEFAHPMDDRGDRSTALDLIDRSLAKVNVHKGWTDTYYLESVKPKEHLLRYRMKYDGYPVFNKNSLSIIETELINTDLRAYRRPLFNLVNALDSDEVTLLSGNEIVRFLTNNDVFQMEHISDIQVGYKLTYSDRVSHTLSLDPAWYMYYKDKWVEVRADQYDDSLTGGN